MAERKLVIEVVGDSRSFERSMQRSAASTARFQGTLGPAQRSFDRLQKAMLVGAGIAAGAVVVGMKKSVEAASNLNESVNAVNVTFGKSAKQIEAFGKVAARETGLSARAFNESATVLGAALQNAGFSLDETATKTIELTKRAADMASVFNTDVDQALGAIQAALRGESDPIERFGVGLNEAAVNAKALELGLARTTKEVDAHDKAEARLALIMEQTNKVSGDFANTSGGAANQQRILRAEIENLEAKLGQALLPVIQKVLAQVLEWTQKLEDNKQLQQDIKQAVEDVVAVAKTMYEAADNVAQAVGGWSDALTILGQFAFVGLMKRWTGAMATFIGVTGTAGAAGTGVAGAAGAAARLHGILKNLALIGTITILVSIKTKDGESFTDYVKNKLAPIARAIEKGDWQSALFGGFFKELPSGPNRQPLPITSPADALTGGSRGGVQLPTQIKSTHPTSGLKGFPAVDIFAKPGTPVRAPENGFITRIQGSATTVGGTYGWGIYFLGSKTGNTYFIKHLSSTAKPGFYKRGAVIGTVSAWAGGASHVHFGVHAGSSPVAKGSRDDDGDDDDSRTETFQAISLRLRTELAAVELTKTAADDLRVLRKIRDNLRAQLDSKKLKPEDKLEVLNALKDVNNQIERIEDKHADKLRAAAKRKRDAMLSAFQGLRKRILDEFDKATAAGLARFDEPTPAERELDELRKRRAAQQQAERLADIQRRLASSDAEERAQAERDLQEYLLDEQERALEERAEAERNDRERQKKAYEEKRAEERTQLEEWLALQEEHLAKGRKSWERFYADLRKIAIRYGFPVGPLGPPPAATPEAARAATSGILPGPGSAAGGHVVESALAIAPSSTRPLTVNVYPQGHVITDVDIGRTVRDELAALSRRGYALP